MVASLTYRTTDGTRWGGGLGSNLSATQVDLNFWTLFSAVQALEDHAASDGAAGIDFINQPTGGNLFFIHLTNHAVLGPFVIPTAQWNPRGAWAASTAYAAYDVVSEDGSLYLITIPHTSGSTFSAFSTDGAGHLLYNLLLQQPADELPTGGVAGQRLVKSTSSPFSTEWATDHVRLHCFIEGQPDVNELVFQYCVTDAMTLPANLVGSVIFQNTPTSTVVIYTMSKNGASIGQIQFDISPESVAITFPSLVSFVPGDVITLNAPSVPDIAQSDISFTFLADLTL